jgi:putative flavoprotein involved in K+ transport
MRTTTIVVVGAGQAGLAMSRCLADRGIDHVVLERGRIANSWRTERWDSLRLLTPNWQSRLPGWQYSGTDPDGFMTMPEVVRYLGGYAGSFAAPVLEGTTVLSVRPAAEGFDVRTDHGGWRARAVVAASGACGTPAVPAVARQLPRRIRQLAPIRYRNPAALAPGGVLVVGASASGVQIADELARAGRRVALSVGRHRRVPRTYRGMDVQWWLDETGLLDVRHDEVADLAAARRGPSLQLVGSPERRSIDLATLAAAGVRVVGRLRDVDGEALTFADDLREQCEGADRDLSRLLDRFDAHASTHGLDGELASPSRPRPVQLPAPPERLSLRREGITTVIWATGYRLQLAWLPRDVLDRDGRLRHDGGVVLDRPGLYAMGLPFLRRRRSSFLDGVGADAAELADHIVGHLADTAPGRARRAACAPTSGVAR